MSKHTPGPWKVPHFADGKGGCDCGFVFGSDDRMGSVATVNFNKGGKNDDDPPIDEAIANAHLIAAAPDLLAALTKIIEMNRQHAADEYGDAETAESWSCITVARAAIAKATGGAA